MAINYKKDTQFADVVFSKLTKRLPIKAMSDIGKKHILPIFLSLLISAFVPLAVML